VAEAEALLAADDADEARLLAAPEAEVKKEEAAEVALLMTLFSAELALARTLLIRLERLLRSAPVAVAATDDKLATSDPADAVIEATSDPTEEINELTFVGRLLPREDATDSAEETAEAASVVRLPARDVASPTIEEASEVAAETMELTSWAATVAAKASTRGLEKCILRIFGWVGCEVVDGYGLWSGCLWRGWCKLIV
jgi:hypothetical protein